MENQSKDDSSIYDNVIELNRNQIVFFNSIMSYDIVVDSGTWRSGKSFGLCLFAILRMKKYPGIRQFIGRKEMSSLKETTFLKFLEILTEFFKLTEKTDFKVVTTPRPQITFPNGSVCVFGDLDTTRVNKWLSAEYSDVLIDEGQEISEIAFDKIRSRQTQTIIEKMSEGQSCNKCIMVMNPPETAERHWTHSKFRNPATKVKNSKMIYSSLKNNTQNIPGNYLQNMLSSVDKNIADIYLNGMWKPLNTHLVYPDYHFPQDFDGNYIEGGNLKYCGHLDNLDNYISIDFGWVHPMSIACWQYDRTKNILYRLYEVVESFMKPDKYCSLLEGNEIIHNNRTYKLPFSIKDSVVVVGPECKQRRQESSGKSNLDIMRTHFKGKIKLNIKIVSTSIQKSVLTVRSMILDASGDRHLFIDPRYNERFLKDCGSYHYPVDKEGNIISEEPEKDNISDHTQDETRYLASYLCKKGKISWQTS